MKEGTNTNMPHACDKIRDTIRYMDINFHPSKMFHVEAVDRKYQEIRERQRMKT
jgi:hypothetical protein